eukprot:TRINITY_DN1914_c0_g1_i2.p1 TRINITY_DN1914_c0_g1~~TRINITY_DN1914_c0_g1_i2.p1  ORF type:complete len:155 (-),score=0.55 TRINITY_DN1914_c0_g1_i2:487-951(-)
MNGGFYDMHNMYQACTANQGDQPDLGGDPRKLATQEMPEFYSQQSWHLQSLRIAVEIFVPINECQNTQHLLQPTINKPQSTRLRSRNIGSRGWRVIERFVLHAFTVRFLHRAAGALAVQPPCYMHTMYVMYTMQSLLENYTKFKFHTRICNASL